MSKKKDDTIAKLAAESDPPTNEKIEDEINADEEAKELVEEEVLGKAEKKSNNEADKPKYKLKDPGTQFAEPGFTLAGIEEKELPENPSAELLARIKAGFIVEVK